MVVNIDHHNCIVSKQLCDFDRDRSTISGNDINRAVRQIQILSLWFINKIISGQTEFVITVSWLEAD
jgi:hypothetical protein